MKTMQSIFQAPRALALAFALSLGGYGTVLGGDINPVLKGSWPGFTRGLVGALAISGDYAYGGVYGGLGVFELSQPSSPQRVGTGDPYVGSMAAVLGNRIYATEYYGGQFLILELQPFMKSVANQGQDLNLSWEGFGLARLQRATRLTNPDWSDVPGSEATNSISLPIEGASAFFRLAKP